MTRSALKSRRLIGLILGVGLFLCLLLLPPMSGLERKAQNAAGVGVLMAAFWIGEVIPLPATALFPLVFFPLLGVLSPKEAAAPFGDEVVFLMMGGLMMAEAMRKWGLHRRLALHTIRLLGSSPSRIILGFMAATSLLSMWMSNSAIAVMMTPIGLSLIMQIQGVDHREDCRPGPFSSALLLGIAYSASIGGVASLVGTPPNAIFVGQVKALFPAAPEIFFYQWMGLGLPISILMLILAWLLLTRVLFPLARKDMLLERGLVGEELAKVGRMNRGERVVLLVFTMAAILWIFRGLWSRWLAEGIKVSDATVAVFAALALFLIPVHPRQGEFALDWHTAIHIPWGVLLLFGGGFALARGLEESGFAGWAGSQLSSLQSVPPFVHILAVCFLMTFLTEVTSNTAVTTLMMPVLAFSAVAIKIHPFLLMMPAAVSASFAFMLPAGTPPNAVVFGSGLVSLPQMARAGVLLNFISIIIVSLMVYFLCPIVFHLDLTALPVWALVKPAP